MKVLVTGGAGYIGSHACKALAEHGHEPIVFDNLRTGHRWAVQWGPFEHGDICDPFALAAAFRKHRPEAVMHFAAPAYVGESMSRPDFYYRVNVAGTLNLLDAARAADVSKVVFSSSCATYGSPDQTPIIESSRQQPVNPYGRAKLMAEITMRDYCAAFGLGVIALRYFNAAGADPSGRLGEEHDPETHLLPLVLQAAAGKIESLQVFGDDYATADGTCVRDYIHVADLASAHLAALGRCTPGEFRAYNLGTGAGASILQVLDIARAVTGRPVPFRMAPRRPGDPAALVADAALARGELGWSPQHGTLDGMLETAWRWMGEHRRVVLAGAIR